MNHAIPLSSSRARRLRGRGVAILALALVSPVWLGLGCGGGKGQKTGIEKTLTGGKMVSTTGDPEEVDALIRARGVGSDVDQVHADALEELETKIVGADNRWLFELSGIPVWAPGVDLRMREEHTDGDMIITLGLSRDRVVETLDALRAHPWRADAPEILSAVLSRAIQAQVDGIVCARRQALLEDAECEAPDMDVVRDTVTSLSDSVRIRSYYEGGQPLDEDRKTLRPFSVLVEIRSSPSWVATAGIPIVAQVPGQDEPVRAVSSADGPMVLSAEDESFTFPEDGVAVAVDRERMLGAFADLWPDTWSQVPGRVVERGHFTLVDVVRVRGKEVGDEVFEKAVAKAAAASGRGALVRIKDFVAKKLVDADDGTLRAELPGYATAWHGRIDAVLRVEVDSDYASRMGAHRIWYEARARGALYDVWTGQKLETIDETVTASGVGEERADLAARELLAQRLVEKLLSGK